jgi:hypothetical protein
VRRIRKSVDDCGSRSRPGGEVTGWRDAALLASTHHTSQETGIASSEAYVGSGVNAEAIKQCLDIMAATGREIPISPEAGGNVLMPQSIKWVRDYCQSQGYTVLP